MRALPRIARKGTRLHWHSRRGGKSHMGVRRLSCQSSSMCNAWRRMYGAHFGHGDRDLR